MKRGTGTPLRYEFPFLRYEHSCSDQSHGAERPDGQVSLTVVALNSLALRSVGTRDFLLVSCQQGTARPAPQTEASGYHYSTIQTVPFSLKQCEQEA